MKPYTSIKGFLGFVLIISLTVGPVTACSGPTYRTDLSSAAVMEDILDELDAEAEYRAVGGNFISASSFGESYADFLALLADHCIVVATDADNNINEMGIFRVRDAINITAAETVVREYVAAQQLRLPDYLSMYNPAEIPKVENAAVKSCGNYIFYTFLNDTDTRKVQAAFRDALTDN